VILLLHHKKIVCIGEDARQLEVIQMLNGFQANLTLIGAFGPIPPSPRVICAELTSRVFEEADAVILPVGGVDNQGRVGDYVLSEEHFQAIPKHAVVFTGTASSYLIEMCQAFGIRLAELFHSDDIAIYNSIATAEGAIMLAIQNTDFTIHNSTTVVLGFGRIGMTLARSLKGLGAHVHVGVREPELFARAWEMGLSPFYLEHITATVSGADLIFNTIPAPVLTEDVIASLPVHVHIIDLASAPGGTDFAAANRRGIEAALAPGLPGRVAPKTSGRIIGDAIIRVLMKAD
jgi:dipicolinate synthase subunit A